MEIPVPMGCCHESLTRHKITTLFQSWVLILGPMTNLRLVCFQLYFKCCTQAAYDSTSERKLASEKETCPRPEPYGDTNLRMCSGMLTFP